MILNVLLSLLGKKGEWKREIFAVNGSFTAKKTGLHWVTGVGGGAAGRVGADTSNRAGGGSGEACKMYPVFLTKGESVPVTIAAGGVGDGGSGGDTSFGSYITLRGAGLAYSGYNYAGGGRALPGFASGASFISATSETLMKMPGTSAITSPPPNDSFKYSAWPHGSKAGGYMYGGAGSIFAAGGNGNDSGAGGAGSRGSGGGAGTTVSGPGGGGYLEVLYQE